MRKTLVGRAQKTFLEARVKVPRDVSVEKKAEQLIIAGPLGTVRSDLSKLDTLGTTAIKVLPEERELAIASCSKEFFGTFQSLLKNKIQGVTQGYLKYLRIQGIGNRAAIKDQTLTFKLGFSHDVSYTLPLSLRAFLPEPTLVGIYGIDKNQVTQAAANIRALRPPSVYKGKGIRYVDEEIKLKAGKKK